MGVAWNGIAVGARLAREAAASVYQVDCITEEASTSDLSVSLEIHLRE
jgi:hypothetical protein